ncbi:MAG: ATP-binding protein [Candidatus Promineifilaceae bacterium]|jgi:serine/threonine-protein kinase RsbW
MGEENVLNVAGRYDQIRTIIKFVTAGGEAAGLDEKALFHLELCCDEASTNIIEHAYGAEDVGPIIVSFQAQNEAFVVTFLDHGRPFNPEDVAEPTYYDDLSDSNIGEFLDQMKVGGLGIHFMRRLMDEVHYNFDLKKGNELTLVKYIPERGV